ncbi:iron complex transport system substrate-binding protein [Enemella evansiae]|nr:iron complex transport system substrate-binding protein [Enemella evansiae]
MLPPIVLLSSLALLGAGCADTSKPATAPTPQPSMGSMSHPPKAGAKGGSGMSMGAPAECRPAPKRTAPPQRVVTMDAGAAAILIKLGVGDKIVGTAAPDFKKAFAGNPIEQQLNAVPVIDPGRGNQEAVLAARPELVTGISPFELGGFDGTPTPEILQQKGIDSYVSCDPANQAVTGIEQTYDYVRELATLMGVAERGEQLAAELQQQAQVTKPQTAPKVLLLSAAPTGGQAINTSGGASLANGIVTLAGGRNLAAGTAARYATLSAETVAAEDPELIVVMSGLNKQTPEQLTEAVRTSPLLAGTTAVRTGKIVTVPQSIMLSPSLLNPQAVQKISAALPTT